MSGGITTGFTKEGPWEPQKAPLKRGMARAESLYKAGPAPYFPGKTLAGFDPAQQAAQAGTLGYAMGARPAAQQALAERQMGRTLIGQPVYQKWRLRDWVRLVLISRI